VINASVAAVESVRDALRFEPRARVYYEYSKEGYIVRKCSEKESITAIWESVNISESV
jgi:hypothetical protein